MRVRPWPWRGYALGLALGGSGCCAGRVYSHHHLDYPATGIPIMFTRPGRATLVVEDAYAHCCCAPGYVDRAWGGFGPQAWGATADEA
jgi:hypothetical protein